MWLRVEHATSFAYDAPIAEAYTELRLRPLGTGGQICSSFRIVTDPPGVPIRGYQDHLGNDVRHLDVLEEHDRIAITAVSEVLTPEAYVDGQSEPSPLERHDYLLPTGYVPLTDPVRTLAEEHRARGGAADRASELMRAVRARLDYVPGATDVHSRADEVLELGRGVCQDFAHVLLAACRCEGIVARYVSGYLYDPALVGDTAASHAWVDVLDDGRGWVSLDPTHDREQTEAYVRVAVGRDYGDVPPTKGIYKGAAHETLSVRVSVQAL
jgi:transglutaminase-like putative cysteine protease